MQLGVFFDSGLWRELLVSLLYHILLLSLFWWLWYERSSCTQLFVERIDNQCLPPPLNIVSFSSKEEFLSQNIGVNKIDDIYR